MAGGVAGRELLFIVLLGVETLTNLVARLTEEESWPFMSSFYYNGLKCVEREKKWQPWIPAVAPYTATPFGVSITHTN